MSAAFGWGFAFGLFAMSFLLLPKYRKAVHFLTDKCKCDNRMQNCKFCLFLSAELGEHI